VVVKLKSIGYGCTHARNNKTILGDVPIVKSLARHVNANLFPKKKMSFYIGVTGAVWFYGNIDHMDSDTSVRFSAVCLGY
jgi:hypothetical protein